MADEREHDIARTPDQRMQYGEIRRRDKEDIGRQGPSPYDKASEDMPDDRVITKGEPEKPGPTESHDDAERRTARDRSEPRQNRPFPPDQALSERGVAGEEDDAYSPAGPIVGESAYNDEVLQTSQVDRTDKLTPLAGGGMSGSLEDEEAREADAERGELGDEGGRRRARHDAVREEMLGDEESA